MNRSDDLRRVNYTCDLWRHVNYKSEIQYAVDTRIFEYDITKANISVLRDANAITEEQYQQLLGMPKLQREIIIGKMEGSNQELIKIKRLGIENARRIFFEMNGIQREEVLSIRNDSVTLIGRDARYLDISDRVKFRLDGEYTSFYHLGFIDLFYFLDLINRKEVLNAKGLGENGNALHRHYMLDFLSEVFYTVQVEGVQPALNLIKTFRDNYISYNLDIGYYREFNPNSGFKLVSSYSYMGMATYSKSIEDKYTLMRCRHIL